MHYAYTYKNERTQILTFVDTGDGSCGLNVHNAGAHLADFVRGWGPMWAWSCFGFEDMNGTILEFVHGTGNACRQVIIRRSMWFFLGTEQLLSSLHKH